MTDAPILIVGLGRSGSTLLGEILNAHSRLAITDESWLFYRAGLEIRKDPSATRGDVGFYNMHVDRADRVRAWRSWLTVLYEAHARREGAARYGDKCPAAQVVIHEVDEICDHHCTYVWTVRHPFDLALSWLERFGDPRVFFRVLSKPHDISKYERTLENALPAVLEAYASNTAIYAALPDDLRSRVMVCKYEDLTSNPRETLESIHAFLGERIEEGQLERTFNRSGRRIVRGDLKFNDLTEIGGQSIGRWKRLSREQLSRYLAYYTQFDLEGCLEQWGYRREIDELRTVHDRVGNGFREI